MHGRRQNCANDIYAASLPGTIPSSDITWFQAQEAASTPGKDCRPAPSGRERQTAPPIKVKGKGLDLEPPNGDLYQDPAVVVQVQSSTGLCWGATYSTATVNDDERFKAKSD